MKALLLAVALAACSGPSTSAACQAVGGACVDVSTCGTDAGHINETECPDFPTLACCLPLTACPTPEPVCCADNATFRPDCAGGQFVCASGSFCD